MSAAVDDRLGNSCPAGLPQDQAAGCIVAIATSHLMAARSLLTLAMGRDRAAAVLYQHADETGAPPRG